MNEISLSSNKQNVKKRLNKEMTMFTNYFENSIYVMTTIFLADFLWRIVKLCVEYRFYRRRYLPDQRFRQIFKRVFSFTPATQGTFFCLVSVILLQFGFNRHFPFDPARFLLYMPWYWLYQCAQISHSNLDYVHWIRARIGMDYGEGMASSYFHGYINLTMPSHTGNLGIRERLRLYEAQENVKFAVQRLVILIPDDLYVAPIIESRILERVKGLETVIINRAGVLRPYQSDVYRFTQTINGQYYYIAMEGATPLLTFFEAIRSNITATWQMKEFRREILFKFYQSLEKIKQKSPDMQKEVELIFYKAKKADGSAQDIGEMLKAHFESIWSKEHHHNE